MNLPGSSFRGMLAAAWCLVVAAGYLLAQQIDAGPAAALVQQRLELVYGGLLAASVALLAYDLYQSRHTPENFLSDGAAGGNVPGSSGPANNAPTDGHFAQAPVPQSSGANLVDRPSPA